MAATSVLHTAPAFTLRPLRCAEWSELSLELLTHTSRAGAASARIVAGGVEVVSLEACPPADPRAVLPILLDALVDWARTHSARWVRLAAPCPPGLEAASAAAGFDPESFELRLDT